jgi:hypothetical protein
MRSSQPLCGMTTKRSEADEKYLRTIFKMNTNNFLNKLFIIDARPHMNALANRTTGGGHEHDDYYTDCEIVFLNIHNIHVMRESLRKITDMALPVSVPTGSNQNSNGSDGPLGSSSNFNQLNNGNNNNNNSNNNNSSAQFQQHQLLHQNDDKHFFVNLENSKWLEHIRTVLSGALKIVKYITVHNSSVLVHCSDGWDRTSQVNY